MKKRWSIFMIVLFVMAAALAACGPDSRVVEVTRVVTETVVEGEREVEVTRVVTETIVETEIVTEELLVTATPDTEADTDRTGAWVDTVVVVEEPNADAAVTRLEAGDIDVYAYTISEPTVYDRIVENQALDSALAYGSSNEITFNPSQCVDGRLNPFSVPRVREAMNYLVDRDFIVAEILGGLAVPRFAPINAASADRARFAAELRALENQYAYNPETANQIITEEMEALGASMQDGVWTFNGEPVELISLIRTEDERLEIGDYVSNQLEDIGFTVIRDYKTSAEASPIWLRGEQSECEYHLYTGGWGSTVISRDAGANFQFYYTPAGLPFPLFQAYTPTPEFDDLANRLANNDFNSLDQRSELFRQILPLTLQDSSRIWLYDRTSITPWIEDLEVASDLAASVYGTPLWAHTLRYSGEVGGSVQWAMPSILTEPWNPQAGSNWTYDQALIRAIGDFAIINDPYTGLNLPQRIETAEVFVQEGLPVGQTLDWLTLEFVDQIEVPDDAWVDWDAANQVFVTAAEAYTETETALQKVVTYYPDDLYDTVTWHDGSSFSAGDVVMYAILGIFDQAKEESPYFDPAQVSALASFQSAFKGMRITSTDPLVVEWYTDNWTLDAEDAVTDGRALWPQYPQGMGAWHQMTIGLLAEEKGLTTFSSSKANELEVEHMSYISGPTVEILGEQLAEASESAFIPYAPTLGQFVTADEAAERYANYQAWSARNGHYWIGTGPFQLQRAFPVEGTVILQRYPAYPDPSTKWAGFSNPPLPEVTLDGDGRVTIGQDANFEVFVDFQEEPYAVEDISSISYLVFDATGALVAQGDAEAVEDGYWTITLDSGLTETLDAGSNTLEVVAVSRLVALPAVDRLEFVTAP